MQSSPEGFEYSQQEIDLRCVPGSAESQTFEDVIRYFKDIIPGKTLTTHYYAPRGEDDIATTAPVEMVIISENGMVTIVTPDAFGNPSLLRVDGRAARFVCSIHEENDLWFQDPADDDETGNGRVWYGIHEKKLPMIYVTIQREEE